MLLRPTTLLALGLSLLTTAQAASSVLDLLPTNFDEVVLTGKPSLVEFFAPWCGHCKTLAPIYEELGHAFEHVKDKVSIAKVDADANRDLGKRFGVQGFPTLKWFDGKSDKPVEYKSGRDLESLTKFVEEKTGLKARGKKAPAASEVEMLTDDSFAKTVGQDKDVLVAFTAPWCGHCKTLAPTWESLAYTFSGDKSSISIAKVDAESPASKRVAKEQGVTSYPTIKFFPRGSSVAEAYSGGRSEADLVDFVNGRVGTHRVPGGALDADAGTVAALDALVAKFTGKQATLAALGEDLARSVEGLKDAAYSAYYVKVVKKLGENEGYAEKEWNRVTGLLRKGGLAPAKRDDLTMRSNILNKFRATVEAVRDEL